jgi:nucleotide-binding universal stress UspA family protein
MFQNILVGVDNSPSSTVTVSFVAALAGRDRAKVHVLHVNRFLVGGRGFTELSDPDAALIVDTALAELAELGLEATGSVRRATCFNLGTAVADEARARRSDVIVIGSRRRRTPPLFGQGSRERIIRASALPVLTAPSPLRVPRRWALHPFGAHSPGAGQPTPLHG